jgi:hypothetical protein
VPSVELSKDSKPITTGITQDMGSLTYRFKTKTIDDYGFYACKATNSQGEAYHYVEVSKTGKTGFVELHIKTSILIP